MERREVRVNGGGKLLMWEEGGLVQLHAIRPDDGRGLYKAWVCGRAGRMLLGTMVPERGRLELRRRLSQGELVRCGCWPILAGEMVLTFSFGQDEWVREERPERLVQDQVLQQVLVGKPFLMRKEENGFVLATPFEPERPFLLAPLFCLSVVRPVRGRAHVLFFFDREGKPVIPEDSGREK